MDLMAISLRLQHTYIKLEKTLVHVFDKQRRVQIKIDNKTDLNGVGQPTQQGIYRLEFIKRSTAASIWVIRTPTPTTSKWVDQALPCRELMIFKHGMVW